MEPSIWVFLLDQAVIPLLFALATPILLMFVHRAVSAFEEKTGIDLAETQERLIIDIVNGAIDYAEEQSHKLTKLDGDQLDGSTKMEQALAFALSAADALGLDVAPELLTKLIESALFEKRAADTD